MENQKIRIRLRAFDHREPVLALLARFRFRLASKSSASTARFT